MEGGGGGGTEGVMYPWDGAPAGPEETGAKAGVLGPGLSLLQQVGCWHLNLSSWVSNMSNTPLPLSRSALTLPLCSAPVLPLLPLEAFWRNVDRLLWWSSGGGAVRLVRGKEKGEG